MLVNAAPVLVGIALLVVINQVILRVPALREQRVIYGANLGLQVAACVGSAVLGLPGTEHAPAVRWLVAVLFGLHAAQNAWGWRHVRPDDAPPA